MKVVVVSQNYPTSFAPNRGAFVYNLVQDISESAEVTVISPVKLWDVLKNIFSRKINYGKEKCRVYRPVYLSLSNKKVVGVNFGKISQKLLELSVYFCFILKVKRADVLYAHFLYNGLACYSVSKKYNIPLIIASGESNYDYFETSKKKYLAVLRFASHVICVSNANYHFLSQYVEPNRMTIVPNTVDFDVFRPLNNKVELRKKYNIPTERFVIGFIGHFIERKGPNRLIKAVELSTSKKNIFIVLVGRGQIEDSDGVKLSVFEPLPNTLLPEMINSFDLFVLPTLSEGHCNVINEVKACCVPIISSKGTTVEQQIEDGVNGFLVHPENISEIAKKIDQLVMDTCLYDRLSTNLKHERTNFVYGNRERAGKILDLLKSTLKK